MRVADVIRINLRVIISNSEIPTIYILEKSVHWKSSFHRFFIFFHTPVIQCKTVGDIVIVDCTSSYISKINPRATCAIRNSAEQIIFYG